jgi:hypothetical protein
MRIPVIRGIIDRRILANFHIDPDVMARILPSPFRPKLANGHAIGGICLIRLRGIRPRFFPIPWGIGSENAAHRIAVEWDVDGQPREGVYIPRRDTSSRLNTLAGGTLFPGDGLELRCENWRVEPLEIDRVGSSYFEDETMFPPGSVEFDCALLMRGVHHEWHGRDDLSQ